jgi:hypothetical protein
MMGNTIKYCKHHLNRSKRLYKYTFQLFRMNMGNQVDFPRVYYTH